MMEWKNYKILGLKQQIFNPPNQKGTNIMEYQYRIGVGCIGCRQCYRCCPAGAITHCPMKIDQEKCTKCGICYEKCAGHKILKIVMDRK